MPTNRGDALLQALRTVLLTVSGLPAQRMWQNQRAEPTPTASSVEDEILLWDTRARELGSASNGAWARSDVLYRVKVRVPKGTDAHVLFALVVAIGDAFRTATMSIDGQTVTVEDIRTGPVLTESQSLYAPINLALTFDHA
jgi:hypothetical protein